MKRLGRSEPLPEAMQGYWVDADDTASQLVVEGGEVTCFGSTVEYDFKEVGEEEGALTVSLRINDSAREDDFQRTNITELVVTPDGDFHAYNVNFSTQFIRPEA